MKTVKMSLISRDGRIVNEWSVPYHRRNDALNHAMDRADQEGHAGVIWGVCTKGKLTHIAFDSHNPAAVQRFAGAAAELLNKKPSL